MANTIIQADCPDGLTLTLKLYAANGDTILNGASGDAMTERTNNSGTYTATVTEALTGVHEARITNASDQSIAKYVTEVLVDDTGTYECVDRIDASGIAAAPSAAVIRTEMDANSTKLAEVTAARMAVLTDWINGGRLDLLLDAIPTTAMRGTDGANTTTPPTVGAVADAVLDEAMSGHTTAGSLGLFLNDQYDLAITGITTGVETRAGKHSVAGTVMMSTNAALSGGTLTAKKVSDDSTFSTYSVTTDAAANNITGMS